MALGFAFSVVNVNFVCLKECNSMRKGMRFVSYVYDLQGSTRVICVCVVVVCACVFDVML